MAKKAQPAATAEKKCVINKKKYDKFLDQNLSKQGSMKNEDFASKIYKDFSKDPANCSHRTGGAGGDPAKMRAAVDAREDRLIKKGYSRELRLKAAHGKLQ